MYTPKFMISRQSGGHRPNDTDIRPSTDRLAIVGRLTPDDRATFGRYLDEQIFNMSADCRSIIGRPSPEASPMTNPLKIGGSLNETFNLGAATKKSSADKKSAKICADVGRQSPDFPIFGSPTVGRPSV